MADPRTLLQRLHRPDLPPGREDELLARSVRDNLQELFNAIQGASVAEPEYGVPDLSILVRGLSRSLASADLNQPDIEEFKGALRRAIEQFEPRLALDRIEARAEDAFHLRFDLRAQLVLEGRTRGPFSACAEVDPVGRLRVS